MILNPDKYLKFRQRNSLIIYQQLKEYYSNEKYTISHYFRLHIIY